MEKEREVENAGRAQIVLLPFPTQGHINPMLEFARRLAARGLPATLAITRFVASSMPQQLPEKTTMVRVVGSISDGHDDGSFAMVQRAHSYLDSFKAAGLRTLAELIREEDAQGRPVRAVVYDAFLPWALDVAKAMGLLAAAFFTQSCAVNAVYHHAYHGRLSVPPPGPTVSIEGLPALNLNETPSFISRPGVYPAFLDMVLNQYLNLEKADTVFVNTFYDLEPQEYLDQFKVLIDSLGAAGSKVSNDELFFAVLDGLPPIYNVTSGIIRYRALSPTFTFEEAASLLLDEEINLSHQQQPAADISALLSQHQFGGRGQGRTRGRGRRAPPLQSSSAPGNRPILPRPTNDKQVASPPGQQSLANTWCQICERRGHKAIDCYQRMNFAYQGRHPPEKLAAMAASSSFDESNWYTDTGASHHITNDIGNLSLASKYEGSDTVRVGNGQGQEDGQDAPPRAS